MKFLERGRPWTPWSLLWQLSAAVGSSPTIAVARASRRAPPVSLYGDRSLITIIRFYINFHWESPDCLLN